MARFALRPVATLATLSLTASAVACTIQRSPAPMRASAMAMDDHMAHMNAADLAAPTRRSAEMGQQGVAGIPASANTAEARLKASPRHAEWVKIAWEPGSADSLMAWVVYPASPNSRAKAPVVVVVHEIFGLSTWVRSVADQAAEIRRLRLFAARSAEINREFWSPEHGNLQPTKPSIERCAAQSIGSLQAIKRLMVKPAG